MIIHVITQRVKAMTDLADIGFSGVQLKVLGFKNFQSAKSTLSGIENIRMIQKRQIIGQDSSQFAFRNFVSLMA